MSSKQSFEDVSSQVDSDALERNILDYWEQKRIFERSLEQTKDGTLYTFYDGPPYASGKPHYGHILQSAIKDTVLRFKTMQGYHVPRRVGWDCHGLPVETLVEKELGFASKRDIEQFGIERFNAKCREVVFRYIDDFTAMLKRMGRWADYANAYATLDRDYMESEWWVFKQLWDQKLVHEAFRSTPYCIRCSTPLSNFEVSMAYKDKTDTAVYVLLEVVNKENLWLVIWTTTPWTLPGNAAVAFGPEVDYVVVRHQGKRLVVARSRVKAVLGEEAEIEGEISYKELEDLRYRPLYPEVTQALEESSSRLFSIVASEHATAEEGTGLVHIAPAFGEEDAAVGKRHGLPVLRTVDREGRFTKEVPHWGGQPIFESNAEIINDLKQRGLLLSQEQYTHSYPFCWRCDTPLIYYALDSWFVRVSRLKKRMLKLNEQIAWIPEHVKKGRFAKGIESAPDWAVSRNRFWSVPLPVWRCQACGEQVCVGSVSELQKLSKVGDQKLKDIHRPFVDELTWPCVACQGTMRRVEEVLDVWFDSGSMPYSQWHYPFANKELVEEGFGANFIAESIEMTRAWFYVLHVLATALTTKDIGLGKDKPAYKNVIASGLIFAENGQKLSKKLKNYPEPDPVIRKYGADVLRFYLLSSTSLGEPYRFSEKELRQLQRNVYLTLWNVYSFFVRYANVWDWKPSGKSSERKPDSRNVLDRWVMIRLKQLEYEVITNTDAYRIDSAARAFIPFIDDLSNWYVRRCRQRFQPSSGMQADQSAFATLYYVLVRLTKILAPYMPFMAEEIYRNLAGGVSVHLELLGKNKALVGDEKELMDVMARARAIVSAGLAIRAKHGIKVRQPLAELVVLGKKLPSSLTEVVQEEVNVKNVKYADQAKGRPAEYAFVDEAGGVGLDLTLTAELAEEGVAREVIRQGQTLRRRAGYALDDRIVLVMTTPDDELRAVLERQKSMIAAALQADRVETDSKHQVDAGDDIVVGGKKLYLGVIK